MKRGMNLPMLSLESAGTASKHRHPSPRSQLSTQTPSPETSRSSVKTVNKLCIFSLTPHLTDCLGSGCAHLTLIATTSSCLTRFGLCHQGEDEKKKKEEELAKEAKEKEAELQDVDELKKIKDTNKLEDKELIAKLCKCKLSESQEQTEDIKNNKEKVVFEHPEHHPAPVAEAESSDCNGHAPLNNQRTLSPQNSLQSYRTLSPNNSLRGHPFVPNHNPVSRQNSLSSHGALSRQNSFRLSRQNSINSQNTLSPQNSVGSGPRGDEYKQNNLSSETATPESKILSDREHKDDPDVGEEEDEYGARERLFLTVANYVFTVIFAFEMAVKVFAKGLFFGKYAYLKSGWNVMDGFLVGVSLVDVVVSMSASKGTRIFGILRVFRLLRTLRPLRVISRAPGLKLVVQTLLSSLRPIGNIVLICCTFFIIFGILGVQPRENYSQWRLLYFISFLLLVGFFVLNMFVGVVVENFHKCRESQEKEEKARRAAKRAKKLERKRRKLREPPYWSNYSKIRLFIHTVINSKYFDLAIAGVIGLNVITMALEYYLMPEELKHALKIFNFFFTSVFILEAMVKMAALGFIRYIKDRWNQLDIIIVMLSVAGIVLEEMKSAVIPINPTIIRVMRVLRIARVLKLLKMAKGIRALLDTVMQALPQVGNLGLLFFLLFFIFAALGVELFGRLECSEIYPCEGLSKHAHFQNFGMAFLTLFRVATGDNWNGIMKDTLREGCDSELVCPSKNCCVSPLIAPVFFVVFVLMAQFVLVNVVVAVLMKHLEDGKENFEDSDDEDNEVLEPVEALLHLSSALRAQQVPYFDNSGYLVEHVSFFLCTSTVSVDSGLFICTHESHRTMDEEADMEAELQRELEVEVDTQNNNQDNPNKDKEDKEQETRFMGSPPTQKSTHLQPHKNICKQTSLPPDFTFTVCPPSPYRQTAGEHSQSSGRNGPNASIENIRTG
ncbi:hypothetical protein LSH36_529g01025 [Paralvinella palmiformis]|uniref:Ion transport domain-containing protein n=1 Tax=Paralvinella palmiformis TaxID=53620 RepID=A0AAD9J7K6_9ANNE|nr:hypothetical protein LSH36_529g01025 [Paralvinella palmiformis]